MSGTSFLPGPNGYPLLSEESESSLVRKSHGGTFCQQFRATFKLSFVQRLRSPVSSIVEILIPILFIVGTIILSIVIKDKEVDGESYVRDEVTAMLIEKQKTLLSKLCYNDNEAGGPIDGLVSCAAGGPKSYCFGKEAGVPINGVCIETTTELSTLFREAVSLFRGYETALMPVPSFDDMVKLQWIAKGIASIVNQHSVLGSILSSGWLFVAPKNSYAESLVDNLNKSTSLFKYVFNGYFSGTDKIDEYMRDNEDIVRTWGVIHLEKVNANSDNPSFDVTLRLNATAVPGTSGTVNRFYSGGHDGAASKYIKSGFLTLQSVVYNHLITNELKLEAPTLPDVVPMGTIAFTESVFLSAARGMVPLMVVLGFLYPVSQCTKRIVLDKELRIKEALLIMGLRQSVQYIVWFVFASIQYLVVSLIIAIALKKTYLKKSDFLVIFFIFFLFSMSIVALSGLIAALFSKARLSSTLAPLIYFVLAAPLFAIGSASNALLSAMCVLSPSAFSVGLSILFNYELSTGFSSKYFATPHDKPNMLFIFVMLVIDLILYLLLMVYLDAVVPNDWGTPRHPLFCILQPIAYFSKRKQEWTSEEDGRNPNGVFEPLTEEEKDKTAVNICGLTKSFKRGKVTFLAVDHLHLSLVEDEISVLLGHNGAGKSTAMNMMTGMIKPDGGDCFIYGHSIREELREARQEIGFCPQHNILWPDLTCREHLEYFSGIKGLSGSEQKAAIDDLLDGVDLQEKRNDASSSLSGGQKRKLSVAIAFVGNSHLVFLDEPTAGMDVRARRHTWELLRRVSRGRTILLSTHFMDEADLLGDRIAIMSKGRLQCAGSGVFLKSNLGVGYNITMSITSTADRNAIISLIHSYVSSAETLSSTAGEISFRLPMSFVHVFAEMLAKIEDSGSVYGIQGYTLSATTLEEIFLRIAHGEDMGGEGLPPAPLGKESGVSNPMEEEKSFSSLENINNREITHTDDNSIVNVGSTGRDHFNRNDSPTPCPAKLCSIWEAERISDEKTLMMCQFRSSMWKRCLNSLRDRRTQCIQIVFPVIMIIFAMLLNMINFTSSPSLQLSSNMYEEQVQIDLANCANLFSTSVPFSSEAKLVIHDEITTAIDLSNYLIDNYNGHSLHRYTSMACGASQVEPTTIFFNMSAPHAPGVGMVGYYGAMIKNALPSSLTRYAEDIFKTNNFPLVRTKIQEAFRDTMKALLMGLLVLIPFSFIPSTFVSWVVKERECKARHLQNVSGLRLSIYWISNYLFDFCSYLIMIILAIIVFLIFQRHEYVSSETFGPTFVLFIFYGLSCIPMSYAISFLFKEHSTAQNTVMLGNFITGFLLVLLVCILTIIPSTQEGGSALRWVCRLFPSYCVGEGIVNLASLAGQQGLGSNISSPWDLEVVGYPIIYMAVEAPLFFLITLFVDHPTVHMRMEMFMRRKHQATEIVTEEDEDVEMECRRVMEDPSSEEDLVRVVNLCKVYGNGKVAVRHLTFGVKPGEVFGFLGTNGAGKTTTISILCQEIGPTSGHAFICGKDTVSESREALRCIGYCPQFDALIDLLTVREHLQLYAGIRGVIPSQRTTVVEELMQLCELTSYAKTRAVALSGGNRRKLSVALALIGGPRVVFLDEPSAGMDPVARRGLWTAVQSITNNCAVVLTTHHLEEVEALAHRVAIMVDGTLRCIGTKTHLKNRYGSGFEMTIRTHENVPRGEVEAFIERSFPTAQLDEVRGHRYTYALPAGTRLSEAFGELERHREDVGIADYAVSQTSIEQVFLRISEGADEWEAEPQEEQEEQEQGEDNRRNMP
ncbi:ABC transporter-like [Trypanosoma melophagium]|uniref:ABC transporter-like n=1 Tax=Trypanosoma melophagium TaxID=715481 RepID=UPI00351A09AF|nr:ABC transporter-like [Trypanosoma melophagium]